MAKCHSPISQFIYLNGKNMALSVQAKANIERCKSQIEGLKREIEGYTATIKCNNAKTDNKSAGEHAKRMKKAAQDKVKVLRDQIARYKAMG